MATSLCHHAHTRTAWHIGPVGVGRLGVRRHPGVVLDASVDHAEGSLPDILADREPGLRRPLIHRRGLHRRVAQPSDQCGRSGAAGPLFVTPNPPNRPNGDRRLRCRRVTRGTISYFSYLHVTYSRVTAGRRACEMRRGALPHSATV